MDDVSWGKELAKLTAANGGIKKCLEHSSMNILLHRHQI
jgi:hypothetical protein